MNKEVYGTTKSQERLDRLNCGLRTLLLTAIMFALETLAGALLHLDRLPRYAYAAQWLLVMSVLAPTLVGIIDGRLLSSDSPRWLKYPALFLWIISIFIAVIWPREWLIALVLFAVFLAVACLLPWKRTIKASSFDNQKQQTSQPSRPTVLNRRGNGFSPQLLIGRISFVRSLLSLACLWIPLIWLANSSGWPVGIWIARLGYSVLAFVWFFKFLGRLADAGKLPRVRYAYMGIGGVLLIGLLGHLKLEGSPFINASVATGWLERINGDEMLALFLAVQIPLAFWPSKSGREGDRIQKRTKPATVNELAISEPFEYLRILLVLSCVFILLIYMDRSSGGNIGSWVARVGYLIVGCAWLIFANGRLEDAGWEQNSYPYFLVVCTLSLTPLLYQWVNGYGAVAIFFLIQIPTILLPSKSVELSSVSPDSADG